MVGFEKVTAENDWAWGFAKPAIDKIVSAPWRQILEGAPPVSGPPSLI